MSAPHPALLIILVTVVALLLAPLASRLVGRIGAQISAELDGGRTGEALNEHLDHSYELSAGALRDDEIKQMLEAQAFLRGDAAPDLDDDLRRVLSGKGDHSADERDELRDEVRQIVIAANEQRERGGMPPLDVEAETASRLARLLGADDDSPS